MILFSDSAERVVFHCGNPADSRNFDALACRYGRDGNKRNTSRLIDQAKGIGSGTIADRSECVTGLSDDNLCIFTVGCCVACNAGGNCATAFGGGSCAQSDEFDLPKEKCGLCVLMSDFGVNLLRVCELVIVAMVDDGTRIVRQNCSLDLLPQRSLLWIADTSA